MEYLIKTYTNEGDVLDNAGSGTTAIACLNTNAIYSNGKKNKSITILF